MIENSALLMMLAGVVILAYSAFRPVTLHRELFSILIGAVLSYTIFYNPSYLSMGLCAIAVVSWIIDGRIGVYHAKTKTQ